jgi:hypothetical protein
VQAAIERELARLEDLGERLFPDVAAHVLGRQGGTGLDAAIGVDAEHRETGHASGPDLAVVAGKENVVVGAEVADVVGRLDVDLAFAVSTANHTGQHAIEVVELGGLEQQPEIVRAVAHR